MSAADAAHTASTSTPLAEPHAGAGRQVVGRSEPAEALARFPSDYRLKRRRLISSLFLRRGPGKKGSIDGTQTSTHGTIRVIYRINDRESSGVSVPYQIGFSVPKRVKRAVDRNRLKRLLRVAFQQSRRAFDILDVPRDRSVSIMVLFRADASAAENQVVDDARIALGNVASKLNGLFADSDLGESPNTQNREADAL